MRVLELTDGIKNILEGFEVVTSDKERKEWVLKASDASFLTILELDAKTLNTFTGTFDSDSDCAARFDADYRKDAEGYHLILNVYLAKVMNDNLSAEIVSEDDFMHLDNDETKEGKLPDNWKELITVEMLKEYAEENNLTLIEDKDSYREDVVRSLELNDVSDLLENTDLSDILDYKNSWEVKDFVIDYVRDNL